jgi:hypothetical protein
LEQFHKICFVGIRCSRSYFSFNGNLLIVK